MFPALVAVSYAQDSGWWGMFGAEKVSPDEDEGHESIGAAKSWTVTGEDGKKRRATVAMGHNPASVVESVMGESSENAAETVKVDPEAAAKKAAQEAMRKKKKSRLEYRIQATRKMTGGKRVLPTSKKAAGATEETLDTVEEEGPPKINLGFEKAAYECDESCGSITIKVIRSGVCDKLCTVQFDTSDGDANCTDDYVSAAGTLKFEAGETEKTIEITIIDDNEWAPDKHFYVRLYGAKTDAGTAGNDIVVNTATCQITILNDDDPGTISFEAKTYQAMDTATSVDIPLVRKDGYDGNVLAFFKTTDGTAKANEDFTPLAEDYEVHFEDKAKGGVVHIDLLKNPENQNKTFTVEITQVEPEGAKLGEFPMCTVIITNDKNYQKLMEDVVAMMDDEMGKYGVGTSSWGEQFHDAMNMGGEGGEDGAEPEFMDYLMHFLSFNWKVLHAFIP